MKHDSPPLGSPCCLVGSSSADAIMAKARPLFWSIKIVGFASCQAGLILFHKNRIF